jgi:hypothetical protein
VNCEDQNLQVALIAPCIKVVTRYGGGGLRVYDYAALVLVAIACFLLRIVLFFQMRRLARWFKSRSVSDVSDTGSAG